MKLLDEMSVVPGDPDLVSVPFARIHEGVDVYVIFRFEPLHNLSLGVSRLLKKFICNMLGDKSRETGAMKTRSGINTSPEAVEALILSPLNMF